MICLFISNHAIISIINPVYQIIKSIFMSNSNNKKHAFLIVKNMCSARHYSIYYNVLQLG